MKRHPCMKSALMREDDGFFCRTPVRCVLVVGLKRRKLCPCRLYTHSKVSTVFHRIAMSSIVWLGSHPQERTVRSSKYVNQHTKFILCSHTRYSRRVVLSHFDVNAYTSIFKPVSIIWGRDHIFQQLSTLFQTYILTFSCKLSHAGNQVRQSISLSFATTFCHYVIFESYILTCSLLPIHFTPDSLSSQRLPWPLPQS